MTPTQKTLERLRETIEQCKPAQPLHSCCHPQNVTAMAESLILCLRFVNFHRDGLDAQAGEGEVEELESRINALLSEEKSD
jgi:hypothetical protein